MFVLGVIPARAGSKGLPGKNLMPLGGVPLIGWTIKAATQSKLLSRTIVSTESEKISAAAKELKADVPFLRPKELATDVTSLLPVLQHAASWLEAERNAAPDVVVLLQPTSPFRSAIEIDLCIRLVLSGADSAQTVTEDRRHPFHRFRMDGDRLSPALLESNSERRQDSPKLYLPTGGVYAARADLVMKEGLLQGKDHRGVICEELSSIDIDSLADFELAEILVREGKLKL